MPDQPTYRPVYKALHRPLTICGVDRRLFFLALLMGASDVQPLLLVLAGVLMFGGLYGFALWATSRDPRCCASSSLRPGAGGATTRQARAVRRGGGAVVRLSRILRDYSEAGGVNALWRSGASSTAGRS